MISVETRGEHWQGYTSCYLYALPTCTEQSFFCLFHFVQIPLFPLMTVEDLHLDPIKMSDSKRTTCPLVCLCLCRRDRLSEHGMEDE